MELTARQCIKLAACEDLPRAAELEQTVKCGGGGEYMQLLCSLEKHACTSCHPVPPGHSPGCGGQGQRYVTWLPAQKQAKLHARCLPYGRLCCSSASPHRTGAQPRGKLEAVWLSKKYLLGTLEPTSLLPVVGVTRCHYECREYGHRSTEKAEKGIGNELAYMTARAALLTGPHQARYLGQTSLALKRS